MLKKIIITSLGVLTILIATVYVFRAETKTFVYALITEDMFVDEDSDDYEPGIVGQQAFPPIKVTRQGTVHQDLGNFSGSRGLIVLFSRSVVW